MKASESPTRRQHSHARLPYLGITAFDDCLRCRHRPERMQHNRRPPQHRRPVYHPCTPAHVVNIPFPLPTSTLTTCSPTARPRLRATLSVPSSRAQPRITPRRPRPVRQHCQTRVLHCLYQRKAHHDKMSQAQNVTCRIRVRARIPAAVPAPHRGARRRRKAEDPRDRTICETSCARIHRRHIHRRPTYTRVKPQSSSARAGPSSRRPPRGKLPGSSNRGGKPRSPSVSSLGTLEPAVVRLWALS